MVTSALTTCYHTSDVIKWDQGPHTVTQSYCWVVDLASSRQSQKQVFHDAIEESPQSSWGAAVAPLVFLNV